MSQSMSLSACGIPRTSSRRTTSCPSIPRAPTTQIMKHVSIRVRSVGTMTRTPGSPHPKPVSREVYLGYLEPHRFQDSRKTPLPMVVTIGKERQGTSIPTGAVHFKANGTMTFSNVDDLLEPFAHEIGMHLPLHIGILVHDLGEPFQVSGEDRILGLSGEHAQGLDPRSRSRARVRGSRSLSCALHSTCGASLCTPGSGDSPRPTIASRAAGSARRWPLGTSASR